MRRITTILFAVSQKLDSSRRIIAEEDIVLIAQKDGTK
jgi:hypothetical protein